MNVFVFHATDNSWKISAWKQVCLNSIFITLIKDKALQFNISLHQSIQHQYKFGWPDVSKLWTGSVVVLL